MKRVFTSRAPIQVVSSFFRTLLQAIRDQQQLPSDLKIPSKAWNLLPKEAWDVFIQEHAKLLPTSTSNPTSPPSNSMPKQYGGVRQTHHTDTAHVDTMDTIKAADDLDTSSDEDTEETAWELACVLHSHKATHQAACFLGMTTTVPHTLSDRTVCVGVNPSKVCSLVSRLSP